MSRSGYTDDFDDEYANWANIRWRGQVASAIRGKRGQAFLKELLTALDEMSEKRLIADELAKDGEFCAIGTVGKKRGIDMSEVDPDDYQSVADTFGIAHQLAQEIVWLNDEGAPTWDETPEQRYSRVRQWVTEKIREESAS